MRQRPTAGDLGRFAEAWITLAQVDLVVRLAPYRWWRRWLQAGNGSMAEDAIAPARPLALAVERAARRHWAHMNCLRRSIALRHLLRRRGIASRLHLGVRSGEGMPEAHAWVSCAGQVLNDAPDVAERYAELSDEAGARLVSGGRVDG